MSMLQLSRGQKDLLEQPLNSTEINYKSSLDTEVRPQTEGAPQAVSHHSKLLRKKSMEFRTFLNIRNPKSSIFFFKNFKIIASQTVIFVF